MSRYLYKKTTIVAPTLTDSIANDTFRSMFNGLHPSLRLKCTFEYSKNGSVSITWTNSSDNIVSLDYVPTTQSIILMTSLKEHIGIINSPTSSLVSHYITNLYKQ